MNWKTKVQFNTCRNDSIHMLDVVTNCRTRGLSCLNSNYGSTTFYQGLAIYHLRSSGPNCCLSSELLVLGKSAFLGQHICTRRELFKGHLWRVDPAVGKTGWERETLLGSLKGCSRGSEGKRLHKTGWSEWGLASSQCISYY